MVEHYPNAACRHLADSKVLLDSCRWDGSVYLAGYVLECSLKAIIAEPSPPNGVDLPGIGHNLDRLTRLLNEMAASKKAGWKRHVSAQLISAIRDGIVSPKMPNWQPSMRYESSGAVTETVAKRWWVLAQRSFAGLAQSLCSGGPQ